MRIAVAQIQPVGGDIAGNLARHLKMLQSAVALDAEFLVFPELSITGYEPELANDLALNGDDTRFDTFQSVCDRDEVTVAIGLPTSDPRGTCISLLIFRPHQPRQLYSKMHRDKVNIVRVL